MVGEPVKNKISLIDIFFSILGIIIIVFYLYSYLKGFFLSPRLLLSSINNSLVANSLITNNNNTYLTLLQELIISASMIFAFYTVLLFYFVDHINEFIYTYATDKSKAIFIEAIIFLILLLPSLFIFFSISLSLDATIIYGTLNIHVINTTVLNNTKSIYSTINNIHGINATVSNNTSSVYFTIKRETYNSIYDLFFGAAIIIINLIILLLARLLPPALSLLARLLPPALSKESLGELILLVIWFILLLFVSLSM